MWVSHKSSLAPKFFNDQPEYGFWIYECILLSLQQLSFDSDALSLRNAPTLWPSSCNSILFILIHLLLIITIFLTKKSWACYALVGTFNLYPSVPFFKKIMDLKFKCLCKVPRKTFLSLFVEMRKVQRIFSRILWCQWQFSEDITTIWISKSKLLYLHLL